MLAAAWPEPSPARACASLAAGRWLVVAAGADALPAARRAVVEPTRLPVEQETAVSGCSPDLTLLHGAEIPVIGLGTSPLRGAESAAAGPDRNRGRLPPDRHRRELPQRGRRRPGHPRLRHRPRARSSSPPSSTGGGTASTASAQAYEASPKRLGVDYIDLLLIHWPNPDQDRYVDAVRGLDALLDDGSVRAIGTSNFKPAHLQRVLDETGIVPDVNQIQLSPYATRSATPRLRRRARDHHRVLEPARRLERRAARRSG